MDTIIFIVAGPLFLISLAAHIYVKLCMRPKDSDQGGDFDDYYHEFEDQHPELARYTKYSKITFTATVVAALLMFLATVL